MRSKYIEIADEYQKHAEMFVAITRRCHLWMEMGLGKTVVVLRAIYLWKELEHINRVLVVATDQGFKTTWPNEIEKWDFTEDFTYTVLTGTPKQRVRLLEEDTTIHLISYTTFIWLLKHYKNKWPYDVVICDEASHIKNQRSERFKYARKIIKHTKYWVNMTGTPATNGLMNLWAPTYLLDRGERLCTSHGRFQTKFCKPLYRITPHHFKWGPTPAGAVAIREAVDDISYSVLEKDHIELPPIIDKEIYVDLPDDVLEIYEQLHTEMVIKIGHTKIAALNGAQVSMKCRQLANGALYLDKKCTESAVIHDAKLDALERIVDDANGSPVLVAYQFRTDVTRIKERFPDAVLAKEVDGDLETQWSEGKIPMLLLSASGVSSLNLQFGGHTGVFFGATYDLDAWAQFRKRLSRRGQTSTVLIYALLTRGTIEPAIWECMLKKKPIQDMLLEEVKKYESRTLP